MDEISKCSQCHYHRSKMIDGCKKIYCHRVLHSAPGQVDALGYYPLVESTSSSGNTWAVGTCSFYTLIGQVIQPPFNNPQY